MDTVYFRRLARCAYHDEAHSLVLADWLLDHALEGAAFHVQCAVALYRLLCEDYPRWKRAPDGTSWLSGDSRLLPFSEWPLSHLAHGLGLKFWRCRVFLLLLHPHLERYAAQVGVLSNLGCGDLLAPHVHRALMAASHRVTWCKEHVIFGRIDDLVEIAVPSPAVTAQRSNHGN